MRRHPEQKRLRRAIDDVEKGLARNQCDSALAGLLQLPDSQRAAYRQRVRQLAAAAIEREAALGHRSALVELGKRIAAAKLLPNPPEDSSREWVEACWKCVWAICDVPPSAPLTRAAEGRALARLIFDSLWPALIDRIPAAVDATDLCLSLDAALLDGQALARLRAAIAESSPARLPQAKPVRSEPPEKPGPATSSALSGAAHLPPTFGAAADAWSRCAVNTGRSEARELALGAWASLDFVAFEVGAREALSKHDANAASAEWLAGAAAGILEAACLEILDRLSPSPREVRQQVGVEPGSNAEWLWEPLSLVELALEMKPTLSEAVRGDLCALFRAAARRSGILLQETLEPTEVDLVALRRLGVALLRNEPATFWWIGSWLEAAKTGREQVARALVPLYREAVERSYSIPLWAKAAEMWDVAFCDGRPTPADRWLEAGARRALRCASELAAWLRRAPAGTRGRFLEVLSAHLAEAEPVLDALWELEPSLRREVAAAYFERIEGLRNSPARLAKLRQMAQLLKAAEVEADDDQLLDALEQLSDSGALPLKPAGIALFRRIHVRALSYEPRLMLIAAELLDEGPLLAAGRALISGGAPIDGCLFAVKVVATEAGYRAAALSLLNETLKRFARQPTMLAAGICHALRQGFPDHYLSRIWVALESALELQPEARALEAVKGVLKLRKVKRARRRARGKREHQPEAGEPAVPVPLAQAAPEQERLL